MSEALPLCDRASAISAAVQVAEKLCIFNPMDNKLNDIATIQDIGSIIELAREAADQLTALTTKNLHAQIKFLAEVILAPWMNASKARSSWLKALVSGRLGALGQPPNSWDSAGRSRRLCSLT